MTERIRFSRRTFLKLAGASVGSALLGEGILAHTDAVYGQQNALIVERLLQISHDLHPQFGIVADPRGSIAQTAKRASYVRSGVGQLEHIGVFTRLEDFTWQQKQDEFLETLSMIREQHALPFIALGGAAPIQGQHMLANSSTPILNGYMEDFVRTIKTYSEPVVVRFLYEMNTPAFSYSQGKYGISATDQVSGFARAAHTMHQLLVEYGIREQVRLMFNPTFEGYSILDYESQYFDLFGLDVYDYSLLPGFYVGNVLLPPGKMAPLDVISGPIHDLTQVAHGKEVMIAEFGSLSQDTAWIQQMLLLLLANNVQTLSYFDSNEADKHSVREGDFRMSAETMAIFRVIYALIQVLHMTPLTSEHRRLVQSYLRFLKIPFVLDDATIKA